MRTALALIGLAFVVTSVSEYDRNINMLRFRTGLFSVIAIYNPRGVKGLAVWGAGSDAENDRPLLLNWLQQS